MNWVHDTDSNKRFMVYDADLPEDAPVVCREVRTEEHARMITAAPKLLAALEGVAETFANVSDAQLAKAGPYTAIPALGRVSIKQAIAIRAAIAEAKGGQS